MAASQDLVWRTAAAFNTLVRGWFYDPGAGHAKARFAGGAFPLDPWVVQTTDPSWLARGEPSFDLPTTWWEDLPSDWQQRFMELARVAADAVVTEAAEGRTPADLTDDEIFIGLTAQALRPDWLTPPRVIGRDGGVIEGLGAAGEVLTHTAINMYARQVEGFPPDLGIVPDGLPRDRPDPSTMITISGQNLADRKYVSFGLTGERLTNAALDELTARIGTTPSHRWVRGALNLQRTTGRQYVPRRSGYWAISSEDEVLQHGPTLEDHLHWLLTQLDPHATYLRQLTAEFELEARIGCFFSQSGDNAEWELSPRMIERIAALGASFWFDSYTDAGGALDELIGD